MSDNKAKESVKVFPNPVSEKLTLDFPDNLKIYQIQLFNAFGQMVLHTQSKEIDVSQISNGLYFLNIKAENTEINKKIIINH